MKQMVMIVIVTILGLQGCEEMVCLDSGKEDMTLVLNCLLREGEDTVRVIVSETCFYRNIGEWKYIPKAEVRLYENGRWVGKAVWNGENCFVMPYQVSAGKIYLVEAMVPGRGCVSGETMIPERIRNYKMEIWQDVRDETYAYGPKAYYYWQDLSDRINYYWLTMRSSNVPCYLEESKEWTRDSVNWEPGGYLYTESSLPDPFNKEGEIDYDGNNSIYYNHYIRVEGVASAQKFFELSYESHRCQYFTTVISLINVDTHCDAYLRSIIANDRMDGVAVTEPWFFHPAEMYSNVKGGTGIVGSYSLVEMRLDSPSVPGKWGPGMTYK